MQDAAAQALRDGLARFDGGRGWRDLGIRSTSTGDWAGQLDRAPVGTGYPDWQQGGRPVEGRRRRRRSASPTARPARCPRPARLDAEARRRRRGVRLPEARHGHHRQADGAGQLCAALDSRSLAAGCSPRRSTPAACWRCRAASTSSAPATTAPTQALRQPGSAFKPIVYVTALENGFTPGDDRSSMRPFCVWQGAGLGNKCFVNFDRRYAGPHTMRWGVEQSRNLMTVRAASTDRHAEDHRHARKLGVGDYGNYLSIALGAGDTTVAAAGQRLCDPRQPGPVGEADDRSTMSRTATARSSTAPTTAAP